MDEQDTVVVQDGQPIPVAQGNVVVVDDPPAPNPVAPVVEETGYVFDFNRATFDDLTAFELAQGNDGNNEQTLAFLTKVTIAWPFPFDPNDPVSWRGKIGLMQFFKSMRIVMKAFRSELAGQGE